MEQQNASLLLRCSRGAGRARSACGRVGRLGAAAIALATLLLAVPAAAPALAAQSPAEAHGRAIAAARAGRFDEALATLAALTAEFPGEIGYLHDYVVVLGWAGRDAEALALLPRLDPERAPAYVLESVAGSARNAGKGLLAIGILMDVVRRFPDRLEGRLALARSLADAGRHDEAAEAVAAAGARQGDSLQILLAKAYLAEARGDAFEALSLYQWALDRDPTSREARRGRILMAARVQSPVIAYELATADPGALGAAELAALHADATAARIRWGAIRATRGRGPERFAETDAALASTDALAARAHTEETPLSGPERTLLLDRIVALQGRYRMAEAVALHDRLRQLGVDTPAYARLATAEALLYLERPEAAGELYRGVLIDQPENFAAELGWFYALVESERHAEAADRIDRLAARTPRLLFADVPGMTRPNPRYQTAAAARSMAPAYADRLDRAEAEVSALVLEAPFSMPLRENAAAVSSLRGRPRRADEELRWILAVEQDNGIADAQRVSPLLEMHEFRAAEHALEHGLRAAPEDKRVQLALDRWQVHNLRQLYVDAAFGRSSGGAPTGTRDYAMDALAYSAPIAYDWRAFAHAHLASATFDTGPVDWRRFGAGVEHRRRDLVLTAEVNAGAGASGGAAVALGGRWWANDSLSVSGTLQTQSNSIPLQARRAGIGGRGVDLAIAYRVHESRAFGAGLRALDFSDGNVRTGASASWFERLVTGPVYKLDVEFHADASSNSLADAPYFNPRRDFTPSLTLVNDWLTWRRYARSFRQRLSATAGSYHQSGFGAGGLWALQYEHVWEVDRRLYLRYGIGRSVRPYDGERTTRDFALLTIDWRY